jgi:hypothetical protein
MEIGRGLLRGRDRQAIRTEAQPAKRAAGGRIAHSPTSGGVFVADPGLQLANGHNAAALAAIGGALPEAHFYCRRGPDEALRVLATSIGVELEPWFERSFYDAYGRDWSLKEAQPYTADLAADYERLLVELRGANGVVLHHTMEWPHLMALAGALAAQPAGGPDHLVFLMFNPGIDHRGRPGSPRRHRGYRMALAALARDRRVRLFAASSEIADACAQALDGAGRPRIHPCFFFDARAAGGAPRTGAPFPGSRVLAYAGDPKPEKGFCELPELVRSLMQRTTAQIVVQYTPSPAISAGPVHEAARALQRMARVEPRLELIERFLPADDLMQLLRGLSSAIFNYQPASYADKTSGLLWQACGAGVPLAIVGESWLAREARRINPYVLVVPDLRRLHGELGAGSLRFRTAPVDADYRGALFRPIGEFLQELAAT